MTTVKDLYLSASGMSSVQEITLREAMTQASVQVQVVCAAHTLSIGATVATVDFGFADNHAVMLSGGVVTDIAYSRPAALYTLTIQDPLIRAVDNFLASDDPTKPFQANNISGEALVGNLLANSGLNSYAFNASGMTFATAKPTDINLVSAWDAINNIAKIAGFTVYCDTAGVVHFSNRKPYIVGGDVSIYAIATGNGKTLTKIDYAESNLGLRNRIVVYGAGGIHSTAQATSPYLPANFYKSLAVGHELIDSQTQADATASVNLTMFNRLDSKAQVSVVGDPTLRARAIVDLTEIHAGLAADKFIVNGATHRVGSGGYTVDLTCTR